MTVEHYLAEAGAFASLAGLLAGFSLSAVIQLLSTSNGDRLVTAGIVVFSASSVMFLYSLIVAVFAFAATAELDRVPEELNSMNVITFTIFLAAVYIFVGGIGIAGWIRSRIAGILTTTFAVISFCFISYAFVRVVSLFT